MKKNNRKKMFTPEDILGYGDDPAGVEVFKASFTEFADNETSTAEMDIGFLADIHMIIKVELGKAMKSARDILALKQGSVIELNRIAGENIDILLNDEHFALGEVVVLDDTYGIRITSITK